MISHLASLYISYHSTTNSTCRHLVSQTLDCTSTELDHHPLCVRVICNCPNSDSVVPVVATVILLLSSSTSKYCSSLRQLDSFLYYLVKELEVWGKIKIGFFDSSNDYVLAQVTVVLMDEIY